MPLDSSVPQETNLVARQIAGKALPPDSPLWKTLFPTEQLRIEGRVPVENSVKYLMAMRLNPTKELYGAAFTASSATNIEDFKTFCNFLVSKKCVNALDGPVSFDLLISVFQSSRFSLPVGK